MGVKHYYVEMKREDLIDYYLRIWYEYSSILNACNSRDMV